MDNRGNGIDYIEPTSRSAPISSQQCEIQCRTSQILHDCELLTKFAETIIDNAFVVFMGEPVIRASVVRELLNDFMEDICKK